MDWEIGDDPTFVLVRDGSTVGALFGGLTRGAPDACDWANPDPILERTIVIDAAVDPLDADRVLVVTSNGSRANGVFEVVDGGRQVNPLAPELGRVLLETVDFAASDPSQVWLSGTRLPQGNPESPAYEPRRAFLYRSRDGGRSFLDADRREIPLRPVDRQIELLGVSPVDPEVLFLRVQGREVDDELRRSGDGGEGFETVLTAETVLAFAIDPRGERVWAGTLDQGLLGSRDGGRRFDERLQPELISRCLAYRPADGLYACGDDAGDGFALGRSADGGWTFEPVFRHADVAGPVACPADSVTRRTCAAWIRDLCADLELEASWCAGGSGPPVDGGGGGGGEGGPEPDGPGSAGGGACAIGGRAIDPAGPGAGPWPGSAFAVPGMLLLGAQRGGRRFRSRRRRRAPVLRGEPRGAGAAGSRRAPSPRPP